MAERLANYYATLVGGEPFVTLSADQDYQYFPSYPKEVKDAIFVPSKELSWNAVDSLYLEINGTDIELHHSRRRYNFDSQTFEDTWKGDASAGDSDDSQETVYHVTVVFSNYTAVAVEVEVDSGESEPTRYIGLVSAEEGEVEVELMQTAEEGYEVSAESESISATLTTTPVLTATGEVLNFYAVTETYEQYHTVTYKWYNEDCSLHEEVQTVEDGDDFPQPIGTPPVMAGWMGAWEPTGPDDSDSGGVTSDITCEYVLTAGSSITLELDWRIAGGSGTETISGFKWCHPFPELPDKRTTEGKTLQGIFLTYGDSDSDEDFDDKRVYNTDAEPCAPLKDRIDFGGYSLVARWMSSAAYVSDLQEIRSLAGTISSTFATLPTAKTDISPIASAENVNFKTGFPQPFERPLPDGKVITRQMINALGNLGSQAQFFEQCGGFYTFDKGFSDAIGGYPEGAILQFFEPSANALFAVRSKHDDNEVNFLEVGVDGVHWEYVGDNPIVSVKVDYSDYEDLSERLFVETGVPDLYEVPYDSYLQAFAVGSVDCESLRRPPSEDVVRLYDDEYSMSQYYVHINGLYYAVGHGRSFLDIYHGGSQAFGSLLMGGFHPCTMLNWGGVKHTHHAVRSCPLSAFSCGVMLSKGDKIRVRNVITEKNGIVEMPTGKRDFVHPMTHGDETIRRKYNYRFAALYKRGLVA